MYSDPKTKDYLGRLEEFAAGTLKNFNHSELWKYHYGKGSHSMLS